MIPLGVDALQQHSAPGPQSGERVTSFSTIQRFILDEISRTRSFIVVFVFGSFLPVPVSSIDLYIFCAALLLSISTSLSSALFVCGAALPPHCRLAVFVWRDTFTPLSPIPLWPTALWAIQIKKGKHNLYSGPRLRCERRVGALKSQLEVWLKIIAGGFVSP